MEALSDSLSRYKCWGKSFTGVSVSLTVCISLDVCCLLARLTPSRSTVPAVDNDILPSHIARSIRCEKKVATFQLIRFTLTTHGDFGPPNVLRLRWDELGNLRGNVAWRDGVDSRKLNPLDRQRLAEVDDASLGCIVRRLQLRDVGNVPAHTGRRDEAAVAVVLHLLAGQAEPGLVLSPEDLAGCFGAEEDGVQVGANHLVVVGEFAVDHAALSPRDASVRHEDVEPAVELLCNAVDGFLRVLSVGNIDLIRLAYARASGSLQYMQAIDLTFNTILARNLIRTCESFLVAVVPYSYVGTGFRQSLGDLQANAGTRSGHDSCLVLQVEHWQDLRLRRCLGIVLAEDAILVHGGVLRRLFATFHNHRVMFVCNCNEDGIDVQC